MMNNRKWRHLSLEETQSRKLYGFGGSLIIVYVLAAFLLVWQLYGATNSRNGLDLMYDGPENAFVMQHVLTIKALSWIPFLILAPMRYRLMPRIALICIAATFLMDFVAINLVIALPMPKSMGVNIFNLVVTAGFAIYFLLSKRVNLTYRLRERAIVQQPATN